MTIPDGQGDRVLESETPDLEEGVHALVLPRNVRHLSELVIDGSDAAQRSIVELLSDMTSLDAARVIVDSITHRERIIGLDDLGPLEQALGLGDT